MAVGSHGGAQPCIRSRTRCPRFAEIHLPPSQPGAHRHQQHSVPLPTLVPKAWHSCRSPSTASPVLRALLATDESPTIADWNRCLELSLNVATVSWIDPTSTSNGINYANRSSCRDTATTSAMLAIASSSSTSTPNFANAAATAGILSISANKSPTAAAPTAVLVWPVPPAQPQPQPQQTRPRQLLQSHRSRSRIRIHGGGCSGGISVCSRRS